jgi:methylenetetrahydrofolate dehydrogenase (NADP+)/methenyltetrahydrofolate cyclohydrolase
MIYVNRKAQACESVGMTSIRQHLPEQTSERELLEQIQRLNQNPNVDGILVQLPLPAQINPFNVINQIDPSKDVDGLHPINAGKLLIGNASGFVPCTPLGVKVILERSHIEVAGKHVVILGRSNLVGKPLAALLMQNASGANATVTVIHSYSQNVKQICSQADILVAAIGKPNYVTADMVKKDATVIDVGINKIPKENGFQIVGDVDFQNVKDKCAHITPVPGGIGPMTIAMLLCNTWKSAKNK